MNFVGAIRSSPDLPSIDWERWINLVRTHPNLRPATSKPGINPFTKEEITIRPDPRTARVFIDSEEAGLVAPCQSNANELNVLGRRAVMVPLALEIAKLLGGVFEEYELRPAMTETIWLACNEPEHMLRFLQNTERNRKLRLFAVACCETSRQLLRNKDHRQALDLASRFADGLATAEELAAAHHQASEYARKVYGRSEPEIRRWRKASAVESALGIVTLNHPMADFASGVTFILNRPIRRSLNKRFANLLRDLFGNPFQPVSIVQTWLTPTVKAIATGIYEEKAFDLMPVLGDALEDGGCDNRDILSHCRQPGEHVRGCWVVDLVLGKE